MQLASEIMEEKIDKMLQVRVPLKPELIDVF